MARSRARQPRRRDTGFPPQVKLLARTRAGGGDIDQAACEACGRWLGRYGGQIQHRLARGAGGSKDPVVNGIANAALLCGTPLDKRTCHGKAESRDPEMEAKGWWIESGNGPEHDPRHVPVMLQSAAGSGVTVWLGEDGKYLTEAPKELAA
jgi:hypothetical protein